MSKLTDEEQDAMAAEYDAEMDVFYDTHYTPVDKALTDIAEIAYETTAGGRYVASLKELHEGIDRIQAVINSLPPRIGATEPT